VWQARRVEAASGRQVKQAPSQAANESLVFGRFGVCGVTHAHLQPSVFERRGVAELHLLGHTQGGHQITALQGRADAGQAGVLGEFKVVRHQGGKRQAGCIDWAGLQGRQQGAQALFTPMLALVGAVVVAVGASVPFQGLDFEVICHGGCSCVFTPLTGRPYLPKIAVISRQKGYGGPVTGVKTPTFALCPYINRANKNAQVPFTLVDQRNFCLAGASDAAK
jgi:hypothetical protein